ncbi:DUF2637 domain-containing protein [Streptomyces sp. A2-16]|uniref:DUF2637 domain-containing protein n=1 Tax=Streptomyces sp. A2-16 TaxID=2781734 RepID=UPI00201291D7|nr:DUF2637 domain-containing protein [Streptomyces sp. A2-16]
MTATTDRKTPPLTRVHKVLIGLVATGAVIIAGIGFAGSYAAVQELAQHKGFGDFSYAFPIGVDAGIVVLLALDLLLTWIRIPFPLLRQTAWLLTVATIAFNGAAAWPDPLGVGMHAVIPVLFVVAVEAARHAVGRIADITADKHMEGVRLTRWLLSPVPTFRLWRRMKLWELRSYEQVIKLEQDRLVYQARLHQRFGRAWRRKAPVASLMPLRLAKYGVPISETAPAGLEAAGIPVPGELERLDVRQDRPALPQQAAADPVDVDLTEYHGHPEAVPEPETYYEGGFRHGGQLATAGGPLAARSDGRPAMVQARIDGPDWLPQQEPSRAEPFASEPEVNPYEAGEVVQSPIGDSSDALPAPESEVVDEATDPVAELEPDLTGVELLEWRYVRLSPEERALSGVKLGELLHKGTGFTPGTARKYLKPIIEKHG